MKAINLHLADLASYRYFHAAITLSESVSSLPKYLNPYDCAYSLRTPMEAADNPVVDNAPNARCRKDHFAPGL